MKAFYKRLFGSNYKKITNALLVSVILFASMFASDIHIPISNQVFFIFAYVFTISIHLQSLFSDSIGKGHDDIAGLLNLPIKDSQFILFYTTSMICYTLFTKVMPLFLLLIAVGRFSCPIILSAAITSISSCCIGTAVFVLFQNRFHPAKILAVLIMICPLAAIWKLSDSLLYLYLYNTIMLVGLIISCIVLLFADSYQFLLHAGSSTKRIHSFKHNLFCVYFFRYLKAHKNYLINTLFMWVLATFLPFLFTQFNLLGTGVSNHIPAADLAAYPVADLATIFLPMGLAILCMNTPMCIVLSCNLSLDQAIRMLPGQMKHFLLPYWIILSCCNLITNMIYLTSWYLITRSFSISTLLIAVLFAFQSALFSVYLEWKHPIHNWKIESDLWHHPRKYIVPCIMLFMAGIISIFHIDLILFVWSLLLIVQLIFVPINYKHNNSPAQ